MAYYDTWDSNDSPLGCNFSNPSPNTSYILDEARVETGWNSGTYSGAQILAVFAAQNLNPGGNVNGCVNVIPTSGGTHPAFIIRDTSVQANMAKYVMHEITHLYGFSHTQTTCGTEIPAIMNTDPSNFECSDQLTNWKPNDDSTIETSRRTWY